MKFATLRPAPDQPPLVALIDAAGQHYWPLNELVPEFQGDMQQLLRDWASLAARIAPKGEGRLLDAARLEPPIHPHRNMFCVGKNYFEHAAEFSHSGYDSSTTADDVIPKFPIIFTKAYNTLIAHGDDIPRHAEVTRQLDYEAEFAVIIGKGGRGIKRANAYDHVWGYTIANDVTARDLQQQHKQWHLGKSLDGLCPMGPWIVTADEVDRDDATIKCWVNGELRQDARLDQLIFDVPTLIETLSAGIELKPGDVILTGTPVGVGIGFNPPRFLQAGDIVRIEVEGMGALENRVGD
ncbi:FAA hydrolase family protein [Billgrantia tianxiuensis]|jgi:2-keto-4-pentenoate hydratase/2-oxohepta-3-ene-1,7-dioic acid hydratase in catechol pathway|uniref:FAA hydrolase family protein n=1 Tax=Billgrantia tianxiuensis TaxID=2497861 RepID=A0A6I6SKP5_9GAMM|nr:MULTISPECIES: fumarylacetoacetate hydrolase family protein [Halomonas]MCE8033550.1 fumarylacetoacetate hydrolase family protein [Halomonas sp. MCCC 1A11057]QHC51149.1 FAA hydrolase family protein [Halomonas tianxiuensis]